ncbi:VHS-domain-containing protein [Laetiporus sulphureus 93-53]|uniref:VHS-domain-containing protein n=1 Tax=Laetiporus sulphureus 93-53 TaxID=1314785 RepID=A0A165ECN8_9APHY|nr:VHS-domain-containing protein [Laetiporus sulphureus 93-53]KZT06740.1 VHS-domain-containing protein [Laetiporus sulphureus 93-53]
MLSSSPGWSSNVSPVEFIVTRACSPSLPEPNYALHLEVAEYINQKKANTPREAAMTIARLVNHRNPHIAMLALALLETLVQSCGYPFHLQISTKEFLNELVRRFPERPPPFPGPVMSRILDLINDWKEGIATESRWKEDLGNIRDMHRLLTFKGYRFRDRPRQPPIASASNLKSADELEAEDREAQEAKLQELIRRGTPRDLAAAQELMKTLAGANPDAKPDYRTQALTELNKLESKVILLNEILDNVDTARGEKFVQGDVYDQVASILTAARPKIQGWISNAETDDPESLNTFLQINDQLNSVLYRYECYKKGDYAQASNPVPPELGGGPNELSLIDFDDSAPSASTGDGATASRSGSNVTPIDELASLFGPSPAASSAIAQPPVMGIGAGSGSNIGMSTGTAQLTSIFGRTNMAAPTPSNGYNLGMGMGMTSLPIQSTRPGAISPSSGQQLGSIRLGTPQQNMSASSSSAPLPMPNYFADNTRVMGTETGMGGQTGMQPLQPQHMRQQQAQQQRPASTAGGVPTGQTQTQAKDPFADLVGLF